MCAAKVSGGFYSYIVSLQKLPLPRSPSAILPRVALVVFFASAFRGCFREGFSAEFWDLLPRKGLEDYVGISAHAHELPRALPRRACFRGPSVSFRAHRKTSFPDQDLMSFCVAHLRLIYRKRKRCSSVAMLLM